MDEEQILHRIGGLVDEEHELRRRLQRGELTSEQEQGRLEQLEASLDQCWDLLRHRRALRAAGQDPEMARPRPIDEVEDYLQ